MVPAQTDPFEDGTSKLLPGPQDPDIWMRLPDGVEPLGLDPEEATLTELDLSVLPEADDVLIDARDAPADGAGWHVAPVWLQPTLATGTLDVLIGESPVGTVAVSEPVWEWLGAAAEQSRYAVGELGVRGTVSGDVETNGVRCALPEIG